MMTSQKSQKKSKNIRTCIVCKCKFEKKELLRFVRENKIVKVDLEHNMPGRGFYICYEDLLRVKDSAIKKITGVEKDILLSYLYEEIEKVIFNHLSSLNKKLKDKCVELFLKDKDGFLTYLRDMENKNINVKNIDIMLSRLNKIKQLNF